MRANARISWKSGRGWKVETGRAARARRRPHRTSTTRRPTDARPEDIEDFVAGARSFLGRLDSALAQYARSARDAQQSRSRERGEADGSIEAEEHPRPEDPAASEEPTPRAEPRPPISPPVRPAAEILEPQVPALEIEFLTPQTADQASPRPGLPATRFGGQPDWMTEPQWPISRELGEPMTFFGQIALHPADLPWLHERRMAYLLSPTTRVGRPTVCGCRSEVRTR